MFGRGWVIAAAGATVALVLWIVFATRGPASGRAPVQNAGAEGLPDGSDAVKEGAESVRIAVAARPLGSQPQWVLELRDSAGRLHHEKGSGKRECVFGGLPAGSVLCAIRAPGFVGEARRIDVEGGRGAVAAMTLSQFGRVSGTVRCEGVPVAGALVQLALPEQAAEALLHLASADRVSGTSRSVESDGNGQYRFDRVPPAQGFSVVAAGFDHAPVRVEAVEVKAGEEATADVTLVAGAHLAGRIVDFRGAPSKGATVHVSERRDKRSVVIWEDEARARTDEDGRFVTPALSGPAVRRLRAWVVVDGVQQVIQHDTSPPDHGTKDVGTLAPHPGTVLFELEGATADAPAILTVSVNGDPPGVGPSITLAGVAFDRDGRIRMAGLPIGKGVYSAASADSRATMDGEFRTTGSDMVVRIPALRQREEAPQPKEQIVVDVAETADPALLLLIADGSIVLWREIGTGNREPVVEKVSPGKYTLFVRAGDRYGQQEVTQVAGQDLRTSITPDRIGRSVSVLVLDDGKPVPGATVRVRGFCKGSRGMRAPWAKAGSDGRAVIRGLPPDIEALTIVAFDATGEFAKGYSIDIGGTEDVTVDLAREHGD
jgi:hypothetical protein